VLTVFEAQHVYGVRPARIAAALI